MAKKGKKKGGKSKKGGEGSTKEFNIPPEKMDGFLLVLKIESCKHSIQHYKQYFTKLKEEMRESRTQFQKLATHDFNEVKRTLVKIDQFGLKELEMVALDVNYKVEKEQMFKLLMQGFQDKIAACKARVETLEIEIAKRSKDLESLVAFGNIPIEDLEQEIDTLKKIKQDSDDKFAKTIGKLSKRHEISLQNTLTRRERIINQAEDIACARQCKKMTDINIEDEKQNRLLKQQIRLMKFDQVQLNEIIDGLEKRHIDLVESSLQVDYDLQYRETIDPEVMTPEIALEKITMAKDLTAPFKKIGLLEPLPGKDLLAQEILNLEISKRRQIAPFGVLGHSMHLSESISTLGGGAKFHGLFLAPSNK